MPQFQIQKFCRVRHWLALTPTLSQFWEREQENAALSGSPSPKIGRRGWGMRAKGLECTQLVLNLELLINN
jgi:hypothetical protein